VACFLTQKRDFERTASRRGERRQYFLGNGFEEIAERCMRQSLLSLGGARHQHTQAAFVRVLDAREPERRLADARLTLEHEGGGARVRWLDEGTEGVKLLLPADDVYGRRPRRRRSCPASTGAYRRCSRASCRPLPRRARSPSNARAARPSTSTRRC